MLVCFVLMAFMVRAVFCAFFWALFWRVFVVTLRLMVGAVFCVFLGALFRCLVFMAVMTVARVVTPWACVHASGTKGEENKGYFKYDIAERV